MNSSSTEEQAWVVQAFGVPEGCPIVFLHGFMQDAFVWTPIAEALAGVYYIAAPTMEPQCEGRASLAHLAESVYGVVQQTMLHSGCSHVALVGYSLGGRVALEYAKRYPETLAALVLESASLGPATEEERQQLEQRNYQWAKQFALANTIEEVVDFWEQEPLFRSQQNLDEQSRAAMRKIRLRSKKDQLVWLLQEAGAHTMLLREENCSFLAKAEFPVLYMAAENDPARMAQLQALQSLNDALIETAQFNCGHNIHFERPIAFTERLQEFIAFAIRSGAQAPNNNKEQL